MPGIIENLANLPFIVSAGTVSKRANIKFFLRHVSLVCYFLKQQSLWYQGDFIAISHI